MLRKNGVILNFEDYVFSIWVIRKNKFISEYEWSCWVFLKSYFKSKSLHGSTYLLIFVACNLFFIIRINFIWRANIFFDICLYI
jgi:hypothetical protein